jgi:hypothetical protein
VPYALFILGKLFSPRIGAGIKNIRGGLFHECIQEMGKTYPPKKILKKITRVFSFTVIKLSWSQKRKIISQRIDIYI